MEWLNYHHLRYFWAVFREGGVAAAGRVLNVSQPTVSAQLRALEQALGEKLMVRSGRRLALTDTGRVVYRYADEIFGLGHQLLEAVKGAGAARGLRLLVGVADVVPKLIAFRLLEPALRLAEPARIECYEDKPERLLADLAVHDLDLVLSDAPVGPGLGLRAYSHLLGECGVGLFGAPALAKVHRVRFPRSLEGAPLLLPTENTSLRRALSGWLQAHGLRPRVVGEFEDSALAKVFAQAGLGLLAAPLAIEREIEEQHGLERVGVLDDLRERFYAISVERRLKHPAVVAISAAARERLFG